MGWSALYAPRRRYRGLAVAAAGADHYVPSCSSFLSRLTSFPAPPGRPPSPFFPCSWRPYSSFLTLTPLHRHFSLLLLHFVPFPLLFLAFLCSTLLSCKVAGSYLGRIVRHIPCNQEMAPVPPMAVFRAGYDGLHPLPFLSPSVLASFVVALRPASVFPLPYSPFLLSINRLCGEGTVNSQLRIRQKNQDLRTKESYSERSHL